jgi:phage tail tape-measure protein
VSKVARVIPGGSVLDAGISALSMYQNATTREEKAEGYGGAAGGLGGAMAGMAAGAALGSVVPVIGTAIGGAVGAFLGGMGGEALGGMLGKSLLGGEDKTVASAEPTKADGAGAPGAVARSLSEASPAPAAAPALAKAVEASKPAAQPVDQQFTFAPNIPVTVQGDAKDPAQLANAMMPYLRQQFDEFARQAHARQMSDAPHVA